MNVKEHLIGSNVIQTFARGGERMTGCFFSSCLSSFGFSACPQQKVDLLKVICWEEQAGALPRCPEQNRLYLRGSEEAMSRAHVLGRLSDSPRVSASRTSPACSIAHGASFPSQGGQSDSRCPQDTSNLISTYMAK